jgi:hypothetical protein
MREHASHYLKFKLNPCQHGFPKSKSTTENWATYLHCIAPPLGSQPQADAIYFDLASAFDLITHTLLLPKLIAIGYSGVYVNWFHSYLTNKHSQVRITGTFPSPFRVFSDVRQGSAVGFLLFDMYINEFCNIVKHSRYLLFAHDI